MTNVQLQHCKINTPPVKVQTNVSNFIITFSTLPVLCPPSFFNSRSLFHLILKFQCFSFFPTCFSVDVDPEATNLKCKGPSESAMGEHSGNAWKQAGGKGTQPEPFRRATGTLKRKLANRECAEHGKEENQPPQKRPPAKAPAGGLGKRSSKSAGKKLIAGQSKLTGFLRL